MPSTTETASACEPCSSLPKILSGEAPDAVAELQTGVVVIGYHQFFHGYSLFIAKTHATEVHLLPAEECQRFLWEMTLVSAAVALAFKPRKMNIDVLGNLHPHVHAHLFPRHAGDPMPKGPVWEIPKAIREHAGTRPTPERLAELRLMLQTALVHVFKNRCEPVRNIRLIHPKLSPSPSPPGDVFLLNGKKNPDMRSGFFSSSYALRIGIRRYRYFSSDPSGRSTAGLIGSICRMRTWVASTDARPSPRNR